MVKRVGRPRSTEKVGRVFGRLRVVAPTRKDDKPAWKCICSCGAEHVVKNCDLKSTKSCGCLRVELGKARATHGMLKTPTYQAWHSMKQRCLNPNNKAWKNYGGRGITVCKRWKDSFEAFYADMGECPDGMSFDRIDNQKGYAPNNCRWTTSKAQARNRRSNANFILNKKQYSLVELSELSGLSVQVLSWRIYKMGMTVDKAVRTPLLRNRRQNKGF